MTRWNLYAGAFTKEFVAVFAELQNSANSWEKAWVTGGTQSSGWKPDAGGPTSGAHFSEGIECLSFDDISGTLRHAESVGEGLVNPQYLAMHPTLPVVYAAEYARTGRLVSLSIGDDGSLERQGAVKSGGELAISVAVHPGGKMAYVAHFGDGTLTSIPLDSDGKPLSAEIVAHGSGDENSVRFSRHHQVRVTPSGHGVLVTDVARDQVVVYGSDADGVLSPEPEGRVGFPARSGPRHIEFHPSGRWVYVVDERASVLHVVTADDFVPGKIRATYSTVPSTYSGNNRPSELHLHPDGRTLFVGNRGFDSVTIFSVTDSGEVEIIGYQPSLGRNLSALRVTPGGRHLIVGNGRPGNLAVFEIDADRRLHAAGAPVDVPAPRSIVFAQAPAAAKMRISGRGAR
jgi:6-phosphogluconolactonase